MSDPGRRRCIALGTLGEVEAIGKRTRFAERPCWIVGGGEPPVDVFAAIPESTDDPLEAEEHFERLAAFVARHRAALRHRVGSRPRASFHFDASLEAVRATFEGAGCEVIGLMDASAPLRVERPPRRAVAPAQGLRRSFYLYEEPLDDGFVALAFVTRAAWRRFLRDVHGDEESLHDPDDLAALVAPRARDEQAHLWVVQRGIVSEEVDLGDLLRIVVDGVEVPRVDHAARVPVAAAATWSLDVGRVALPPLTGTPLAARDGAVPLAWEIRRAPKRWPKRCALGPVELVT